MSLATDQPLKAEAISKSFGPRQVLAGISADFPRSSVTAILGPSGCGKTSFLNILAGLIPADSGRLTGFPKASFSYSFQDPRLLPWLSCLDNVLFALSGLEDRKTCGERALRFIAAAGLEAYSAFKPPQLSGGMRRRLSLARAFSYPSDVLLLDEAFASVDLKLRIELMDLFSLLWREEKRTTIFVTHDVQDALYLADRILVFSSRPARLLDVLSIDTPREDRSYGSKAFSELEELLYRKILS
ncbi:MAG: ABC transporter ATP-binding protein [Spirochaetia bacterium]|nr:ABC transporter ATP-binding protein [Spirochaetia bacterium]MCE1208520.1 ABC transporter ATP-binding protein [Spirochaetia bacterium]